MFYDGTDLTDYFRINYQLPAHPNQMLNLVKLPGRPGKLLRSAELEELRIPVTLRLRNRPQDDMGEYRAFYRSLLSRQTPCEAIFLEEGPWYWEGLFEGESYFDTLWYTGKAETTFVCPDPIATSLDESRVEVAGTEYKGTYQGTWEAWPRIEMRSKSGDKVTVTDMLTGRYVQANISGLNGQLVVVDMKRQQVTLNGTNQRVVFASDYFPLKPGAFHLRFSHPGATVTWRDRRL